MRKNNLQWSAFFGAILLGSALFSQTKKDKNANSVILNFTFESFNDQQVEVSEPGQIGLLKGIKPSSQFVADVFKGSGDFGVGVNIYGFAKPLVFSEEKFEGNDAALFSKDVKVDPNNAYAGIVTYKQGKLAKERSYITIPFVKGKTQLTMSPGKMYCIEMSVSLAEASKFSSNNIGIMFVKNPSDYQTENIEESSGPFYDDNAAGRVVYHYKNRIFNSYGGWDKVCNVYKAKGDEKGIVIGNFAMNEKTKYEVNKKVDPKKMEMDGEEFAAVPALQPMAYYYIDNIRIKEVDSKDKCYCMKIDTTTMVQLSRTVITKDLVISEKLSEVQNIEAQVIYYSQGEKKPDDTGKDIIELLGNYMKKNEGVSVEIFSHNDRAEDSLALEYLDDEDMVEQFSNLSEKRFDYIRERLVEKFGISASRIIPQSKGADDENTKELPKLQDKRTIDRSDPELIDAYNRRVTFVIK
jgi:outer membrane protein OmpA-like peptidoglycan-associated protein